MNGNGTYGGYLQETSELADRIRTLYEGTHVVSSKDLDVKSWENLGAKCIRV